MKIDQKCNCGGNLKYFIKNGVCYLKCTKCKKKT